tara:strand:+ start:3879 stop:4862 length:984 start_codon:yes stop_codon:yes gene_type:complete
MNNKLDTLTEQQKADFIRDINNAKESLSILTEQQKTQLKQDLTILIKEAFETGDEELLLEFPPILAVLGGLAAAGTATWVADSVGITDNWYDKGVKWFDPFHYAAEGALRGAEALGLEGAKEWQSPFFAQTPDRLKSGWFVDYIKAGVNAGDWSLGNTGIDALDPEMMSDEMKALSQGSDAQFENADMDELEKEYQKTQAGHEEVAKIESGEAEEDSPWEQLLNKFKDMLGIGDTEAAEGEKAAEGGVSAVGTAESLTGAPEAAAAGTAAPELAGAFRERWAQEIQGLPAEEQKFASSIGEMLVKRETGQTLEPFEAELLQVLETGG